MNIAGKCGSHPPGPSTTTVIGVYLSIHIEKTPDLQSELIKVEELKTCNDCSTANSLSSTASMYSVCMKSKTVCYPHIKGKFI